MCGVGGVRNTTRIKKLENIINTWDLIITELNVIRALRIFDFPQL